MDKSHWWTFSCYVFIPLHSVLIQLVCTIIRLCSVQRDCDYPIIFRESEAVGLLGYYKVWSNLKETVGVKPTKKSPVGVDYILKVRGLNKILQKRALWKW